MKLNRRSFLKTILAGVGGLFIFKPQELDSNKHLTYINGSEWTDSEISEFRRILENKVPLRYGGKVEFVDWDVYQNECYDLKEFSNYYSYWSEHEQKYIWIKKDKTRSIDNYSNIKIFNGGWDTEDED